MATELLQVFVRYAVRVVNHTRQLSGVPAVDTVVVMVDECFAAEMKFASRYPEGDITAVLRNALLSMQFIDEDVHIALVLSSLQIGPTGATTSGRDIVPIALCQETKS